MKILISIMLGAMVTALDFEGTGQIRTLHGPTENTGADIGCLTSQAQWTADNTQCDVFTGIRKDNYTITLNTSTGLPLGLDNVVVVARDGLTKTTWMVRDIQGRTYRLSTTDTNIQAALLWGNTRRPGP